MSSLDQPARQLGTLSGAMRREARKLERKGYRSEAAQLMGQAAQQRVSETAGRMALGGSGIQDAEEAETAQMRRRELLTQTAAQAERDRQQSSLYNADGTINVNAPEGSNIAGRQNLYNEMVISGRSGTPTDETLAGFRDRAKKLGIADTAFNRVFGKIKTAADLKIEEDKKKDKNNTGTRDTGFTGREGLNNITAQ